MRTHSCFVALLIITTWTLAAWPTCRAAWAADVDDASTAVETEGSVWNYDKQEVQRRLEEMASAQLKRPLFTGFSAAVVDDQQLLWSKGFGLADEKSGRPARANTLYRVGSISKLFTALACMQLVEQQRIDLDAPVRSYLPSFRIEVPFSAAQPITLRMLMCHRSGMIRESPIGGYFDGNEPTMEETVASISQCALVNPPGTHYRYSNVGPTIVGEVVARTAGVDFETYQQEHLFEPLGMKSSTYHIGSLDRARLATGYMRVAKDNGTFERVAAPLFELGTLPAGNLYSSVEDLGRFASALFAGGNVEGREVISSQSLAEMWKPQLTDGEVGFGLGFYVGTHRGHQLISHSGAVYGHSSVLYVLPKQKIAAIVLANEDTTSGPVQQLATEALDVMLAAKLGKPLPEKTALDQLDAVQQAAFEGTYLSKSYWAGVGSDGKAVTINISGQIGTLRFVGNDEFQANGRFYNNSPVTFHRDEQGKVHSFTALDQSFTRIDPGKTPPIPNAWRGFLGSYGPSFIPLVVTEKYGCLFAMTENMMDYRLTPQNRVVFNMPPGLYTDEEVVFQTDKDGRAHSAILANMRLERID